MVEARSVNVKKTTTRQYLNKNVVIIYCTIMMTSNYTTIIGGVWINTTMSERNPPLYCTFTVITMYAGTPTKRNNYKRHDKLGYSFNLLHGVSSWLVASFSRGCFRVLP